MQVAGDFFLALAVHAQGLRAHLGYLLLRAGNIGRKVGLGARQAGDIAFQGAQAIDGGVALISEAPRGAQLVIDQLGLLFGGFHLAVDARDLRVQLRFLLVHHRLLRRQRSGAGQKFSLFALQGVFGHRAFFGLQRGPFHGVGNLAVAALFGHQAGAQGFQIDQLVFQRLFRALDFRRGHFDHDLAGLDVLAFVDVQNRNHAAFAMLDGLAVTRHGDHAFSGGGGVEMGEGRPPQKDAEKGQDHDPAKPKLARGIILAQGRGVFSSQGGGGRGKPGDDRKARGAGGGR